MSDLPPAGVYGDTGVNPEPKTPFLDPAQPEVPPVGTDLASEPNPTPSVLGQAIRRLLER